MYLDAVYMCVYYAMNISRAINVCTVCMYVWYEVKVFSC